MSAVEVKVYDALATNPQPVVLGSLADPREHGVLGLTGDEQRVVQQVQLPGAEAITVFGRGNRQESLTLRTVRIHSSLAAALKHWLRHPREVPVEVDVLFQQGGYACWLNGCAIQSVTRFDRPAGGLTTLFEYHLVGGVWADRQT